MGRNNDLRVKPGQDSLPVALGEVAPGDSREEDVDLGIPDRLVDQVGTALVVEADTGDADADSPNLAAPIGGGGEGVKVLAGQLSAIGTARPSRSLEWALGVKETSKGPSS